MLTTTAALALMASSATAIHIPDLRPRDATGFLKPWVTVDSNGTALTVTPYLSTISGIPMTIDGAPAHLTATVQTYTDNGIKTTSTGTAPQATATTKDGAGAFQVCTNKNGTNAPWCLPQANTSWYPGTTYYFTWDSTYFNETNTTLMIQGNYINLTTGATISQAFETDKWAASWGFKSFTIDPSLLQGSSAGKNISLQIAALKTGSQHSDVIPGPTILVTNPPVFHQEGAKPPTGPALYIGLPTIVGFVIVCVAGTFFWNRKQRQIGLGNIMSRSRHGYGVGKSARRRMRLGKNKKNAAERIRLMEREIEASGGEVYRDEPRRNNVPDRIEMPRRDSDALESLAGTPTEESRMDFHRPEITKGERKYFRDETRRQDDEKF